MGLDYSLISLKIKQLERANQAPVTKDINSPESKIKTLAKTARKNTLLSPPYSLSAKI